MSIKEHNEREGKGKASARNINELTCDERYNFPIV